jgi:hypothetical protein
MAGCALAVSTLETIAIRKLREITRRAIDRIRVWEKGVVLAAIF